MVVSTPDEWYMLKNNILYNQILKDDGILIIPKGQSHSSHL